MRTAFSLDSRKVRLPWWGWLGLVAAVTGGGLFAHALASARLHRIEVEGTHHASPVAIRHLADVREGQRLLSADLSAVVTGVLRHPWVSSARVSRVYPDALRIEVQEHDPAILLMHHGLFRVSEAGEIFGRARSSDLDHPILTGIHSDLIDDNGQVARRIIHDALDVLHALDDASAVHRAQLSEVHFDENLGFALLLRNGTRITLGYRSPANQMARLDAMVDAGLDLFIPSEIDMDIDGMAVVTPLST